MIYLFAYGNVFTISCSLLIIFISGLKLLFQKYHHCVKQFSGGCDLWLLFVGSDLGTNCLQRSPADNKRCNYRSLRVKADSVLLVHVTLYRHVHAIFALQIYRLLQL